MTSKKQFRSLTLGRVAATGALALAIAFVLTVFASPASQAQTYNVIHNFTGGQDGATPEAGVTMDVAGNLYGTAYYGGVGSGTAYQLKNKGSGWVFNPLYSFGMSNNPDGLYPEARVVFGPNGTLYGTTYVGGLSGTYCCGTVFNLRPQPRACTSALCPWTEKVLHAFAWYPNDGGYPGFGDLTFDQPGNIYGTTILGGAYNDGAVYELTPTGVSLLHSFAGSDGLQPYGGVIFDKDGNLYGTTYGGGRFGNCTSGCGTVFQLTQSIGWQETLLHSFSNGSDGSHLYAGLIFDPSGNLYGAASDGGVGGGGIVFELSPPGDWTTLTVLYGFTGSAGGNCPAISMGGGSGPWAALALDANGNLYGTTVCDGAYGFGNVFKLTPPYGQQNYTSLHDFCAGGPPCSDGAYPISDVLLHTNGKLYGTASAGGSQTVGVVWEITP